MHALRRFTIDPIIVAGLESLAAHEHLSELISCLGPKTLAFSLDLKQGRPITQIDKWRDEQPIDIVRSVLASGIQRLIVLDLADVGVGEGPRTLELCREIRHEFPAIELVAGGGVRGLDDLKALAAAGCDAALVASALHDGRLTRDDLAKIQDIGR
jgi:phosphoribosylformimino-5-aminoimidazole carboxamide ribotide isomerase